MHQDYLVERLVQRGYALVWARTVPPVEEVVFNHNIILEKVRLTKEQKILDKDEIEILGRIEKRNI